MDVEALHAIAGRLGRVDLADASRAELLAALGAVRRVRAWADAAEVAIAARLSAVSDDAAAAADVAAAAHREPRHGALVVRRAATVAAVGGLAEALTSGDVDGAHVDVISRVVRSLPSAQRTGLLAAAGRLVSAAALSASTPEELATALQREATRLAGDGGEGRFEAQRRASRLRTWTDRATGMWKLSGQFDPLNGALLHGRLQAAMAALFARSVPASAPEDPGERADHLRALCLLALTCGFAAAFDDRSGPPTTGGGGVAEPATPRRAPFDGGDRDAAAAGTGVMPTGGGVDPDGFLEPASLSSGVVGRFGRPELVVVVDLTQLGPDGRPSVDWGLPFELPWRVLRDVAAHASVHPVVVSHGTIVGAKGELDLGRTTRLANAAQRRALRALYPTCAIPDCPVRFGLTTPHHVRWWRHGGTTDLANLLPLCNRHHHAVHDEGWVLELGPARELVITRPDGTVMSTGPPVRPCPEAA